MSTHAAERFLLEGMTVIELSSFVATPLCGATLADLGARVIRVEDRGGGPDRGRWPLAADDSSHYWTGLNRGKEAIAVDLRSEAGQELVARMLEESGEDGGILISNTERYAALVDDALRSRRPDLIHVNLAGKAGGGPAVDYTIQAETGFPFLTGEPGGDRPVNSPVPTWDLTAGLYLATGILAAVRRRSRTGQGASLRLALADIPLVTASQLGILAEAQLTPEQARQAAGNSVYGSFGRDFAARDGERFMIVALTPRQWADLVGTTGIGDALTALEPALGADFSDEGDRYRHREVIGALVQAWFAARSADEIREALGATRVLWAEYRTFTELAEQGVLQEHPLFSEVDHGAAGRYAAATSPLQIDGTVGMPRPAPRVGEHTASVLSDLLGLDAETLGRLRTDGLVAEAVDRG